MSTAAPRQQQRPTQSRLPTAPLTSREHDARFAPAIEDAKRGSCCVANFADVAVHAKRTTSEPSLRVSKPGDVHEREADAAADRASRAPGTTVAPAHTSDSRDGGNIDHGTRSLMQARLGADFSDVRIHADAHAATLSDQLGARAFTVGRDIYFGSGEYAPTSTNGRRLLAHELAHTVQQKPARLQPQPTSNAQGITGLGIPARDEYDGTAVNTVTPAPAMVQRSTKWNAATVHQNIDVAEYLFGGPPPVSWGMLNGTLLKHDSDADAAIRGHEPTLKTTSAKKGSDTEWTAKVATVPQQVGTDDESVVSVGPWTKTITKADANSKLGLAECSGTGQTVFTAHGTPNENDFAAANRRHEDHHVDDTKAVFEATIGAWDKKVENAKSKKTKFTGPTKDDAIAAVWSAMGHTPQEVARKYLADYLAAGDAYHATPAGKKMNATNIQAVPGCATCSADVTNPS